MTQRIKITGYVSTEAVGREFIDPSHDSGLTSEGYDELMNEYSLSDLEDVQTELVEE